MVGVDNSSDLETMKSPESIEEERGDEKRMMDGESSRGVSPGKKRVRLDGDPDAEDQNPAICAMEEEEEEQQQQKQQMMVGVDPEETIQEEWKPSLKLYTREEYTMDDLERLDELMARLREEQGRIYAQELAKRKAERMLDHKEIQRVQTILQNVESLTLQVRRVPTRFTFTDETSMKEFFVLDPWDDKDFMHRDPDEPSLDLYYKRLVPIVKNVFREGDIIDEHKLKAEYDVFLLECEYEKLSPSGFIPKDKTPVFECVCSFRPTLQQLKFDKWMENRRHMKCGKEEHRKAIEALHAKNLREDCSTRIRFIKFKRAWAKKHGIISEETCQQRDGDVTEATVGV